ncbi:MAG: hypothetical protein OXG35_05565 [Acidobacteria bacterium]|nr:hypothetical protein [Acidobacteriota bacterium]
MRATGVVDIRRVADRGRGGVPELLIGGLLEGEDDRGAAYLLSGAAMASADAAAGAADGQEGAYRRSPELRGS